jgi:hypothetical protein
LVGTGDHLGLQMVAFEASNGRLDECRSGDRVESGGLRGAGGVARRKALQRGFNAR